MLSIFGKGMRRFSVKRGESIQWMGCWLRICTGKAIQWRGPGHSVNRQTLKTFRSCCPHPLPENRLLVFLLLYRCLQSPYFRSLVHVDLKQKAWVSGRKKVHKPKLLSPDIFQCGRGLPREGAGAKKFGMFLETREIKLFGRISGFCRDVPGPVLLFLGFFRFPW